MQLDDRAEIFKNKTSRLIPLNKERHIGTIHSIKTNFVFLSWCVTFRLE